MAERGTKAKIAAGAIVLAVALGIAATRFSFLQGSPSQGRTKTVAAPELVGISQWINSPPLTLSSLRGKVVMIDFWTYSCINCLRTLPYDRRFYATYHPYGFEIVGVHSPEFSFEKVVTNVRAAVKRLQVPYPVAMDNDMQTWRAYRNAYWPRVYLIDASGRITFDYAGEGGEDQIQSQIRTLLSQAGAKTLPPPIDLTQESFDRRMTPEIYAGYQNGSQQGSLANTQGYSPDRLVDYGAPTKQDIASIGTTGQFFVAGPWRAQPEYLEAAGAGARVILPYFARKQFIVASPSGAPVKIAVTLDGDTRTTHTIEITGSQLFTTFERARIGSHVLTIDAPKGFRLYTFTFG